MENVKEKLTTILREHGRLSSQHYLEEENMTKKNRYKEGDLDKDSQAPAKIDVSAAPVSAMPSDTTSQDNKGIQKEAENQEHKDVQATPTSSNSLPADGTPMKPDASQNDKAIQKESDDADEDDKPDYAEKFREAEDDMHKLVDVVEALRCKMEAMEKRLEALSPAAHAEPDGDEAPAAAPAAEPMKPVNEAHKDEEPIGPRTESAILRGAFTESVADVAEKSKANATLARLIRG